MRLRTHSLPLFSLLQALLASLFNFLSKAPLGLPPTCLLSENEQNLVQPIFLNYLCALTGSWVWAQLNGYYPTHTNSLMLEQISNHTSTLKLLLVTY